MLLIYIATEVITKILTIEFKLKQVQRYSQGRRHEFDGGGGSMYWNFGRWGGVNMVKTLKFKKVPHIFQILAFLLY